VLRDYPEWTPARVESAMVGDQSIPVKLNSPLPLLVIYNTAMVEENGDVHFFDDIYGHDAAMEKALAAFRRSTASGFPYWIATLHTISR
jgi:murein L,D-transpeptidase YcbB/YkuD